MKRTLQLIKSGGVLLTLLLISLVLPSSAWAEETTIYEETFGSASSNTAVSKFSAWSNELTSTIISSSDWSVSKNTSGACSLTGSSGNSNIYSGKGGDILFDFSKSTSTLSGYTTVTLSLNFCKGSASGSDNAVKLYISYDGGTNYGSNILTNNTSDGGTTWKAFSYTINVSDASDNSITDLSNLVLKFTGTSNKTVRVDDIKITGTKSGSSEPDTRDKTTLAFGSDTYSVNVGENVTTTTTLTNSSTEEEITDATITFSSSDTNVATVDNAGYVTGVAAGTATITATYAGDESNYKGSTATCTVTVTDPNAPSVVYKKITSADDIVAGGSYIVVCESYNKAMGSSNSTGYMNPVDITTTNDTYSGDVNTSSTPYEITLAKASDEDTYFSIKTEEGYLYSATSSAKSNKTNIKAASSLGTSTNYQWVISYSNGSVTLETNAQTTRQILYSKSDTDERFANYASSNASTSGYGTVTLYKKVETKKAETGTFSITTENYATFYSEDAFIMPDGVKGGIVTAASSNEDGTKTLTIDYRYTEGTTVPAKTALLLNGENNTYTYTKTTSTEEAPTGNYLHGADAVDSEGKTYVADNMYYYILTHDTDGNNYGFYWAASDGGAVTYHAPFAFLALDKSAGIKGFSLSDATTGITTVQTAAPANAAIYTFSGVRVNATNTNTLPAGIYIVGGKKVLVK